MRSHPVRHPDGKALDKLVVGFCAQAVGEEHNHAPHQLGALLNGGSTLVAEHSLDANFALHVVKTLDKPDGYDRRSMARRSINALQAWPG